MPEWKTVLMEKIYPKCYGTGHNYGNSTVNTGSLCDACEGYGKIWIQKTIKVEE